MRPFAFAIISVLALGPSSAWATTYYASARLDLADPRPGDGICGWALRPPPPPPDGTPPAPDDRPREICTLRAAIEEANAHPGDDVIILSGGVYVLDLRGFGDVSITDDVRIEGQGPSSRSCLRWLLGDDFRGCNPIPDRVPTVIRLNRLHDRAFQIESRVEVSISDLTISNGSAFSGGGGAIHNAGHLTLFNVGLTDNRATTGGALFNSGYANLQRTTLSDNHADGGRTACGGAITNDGQLVANRVWMQGNDSTGSGGAVCNHSLAETDPPHGFDHLPTLTLNEATVTINTAALAGGAVYTSTSALIAESFLYINWAEDGAGLHVARSARAGVITSVVNTRIRANWATGSTHPDTRRDQGGIGAGISTRGDLWVQESDISSNWAAIKGGGIAVSDTGHLHLSQSLLTRNSARRDGGGVYAVAGNNDIVHSTISDNSARWGGGVYLDRGTLALRSVTLAENEAHRGAANIHMVSGALTLRNSIVAAAVGGPNCVFPPAGVTVTGHNIEDAADCRVGAGAHLDPLLEPLADNGGFTQTHALGDRSPAIDIVPAAECDIAMSPLALLVDQRGRPRPVGLGCDAGAFERDYMLPAWVGDGGLIYENVFLLVTDVVATSLSISLELGGDQKGKAYGDKLLTDATALANLVNTAIHSPDPQQGLSLLSTAKSALGALDQSYAAAAGCCGPVPSELAKMRFVSHVERFRTALGAALGEAPKPVEK